MKEEGRGRRKRLCVVLYCVVLREGRGRKEGRKASLGGEVGAKARGEYCFGRKETRRVDENMGDGLLRFLSIKP